MAHTRVVLTSVVVLMLATSLARAETSTPVTASASAAPEAADGYPLPESPPEARDPARATAERSRGAQLLKLKFYAAAKDAFRRAYALSGKPDDGQAVASAAEAEGDLAEAADVVAFLLETSVPPLPPTVRAKLIAKLAALESDLAALTIDAKTPGAAVFVDGKDRGTTPLAAPLRLAPGTHVVEVRKRGLSPFERAIEVGPRARETVAVTLSEPPTTAPLRVTATGAVEGARVFLDGEDVGPVPWQGDVDVKTYTVVVKSERATSKESKVRVAARTGAELSVDVAALQAPVVIAVQPRDAEIALDGKVVGTGRLETALPLGIVKVALRAPGYLPRTFKLEIRDTKPVTRDIHLSPDVDEAPVEEQDPREGVFGGIAAAGHMDVTSPSSPCAADVVCNEGTPTGLALALDVGYRFGWLALGLHAEAFGATRSSELQARGAPSSASETYDERTRQWELGTFIGAGPRLITRAPWAFTVGLTPGVSLREFVLQRNVSGTVTESYTEDIGVVTAPSGMLDVGILFGSTPGPKLHAGVYGLATLHGDDRTSPAVRRQGYTQLTAASAFQLTLGATLGMFFGH